MQILEPNRQVAIVCFLPASSCTQFHADGLNNAALTHRSSRPPYILPDSQDRKYTAPKVRNHCPHPGKTRDTFTCHAIPKTSAPWAAPRHALHPSTRAVATVDMRGVAVPGRGRPESWRAAYRDGKEEDGAAWLYIAAARKVFS
jgi:hypothetical protein